MVEKCSTCIKYQPKQRSEPLQPHEIPNYPWQKIGTDLFSHNRKDFLVVSDYYSLYPEAIQLQSTSSQAVIHALKSIISRHGVPEVIVSDNGPQFSSGAFGQFSKEWDFKHVTSSPYYHQSNGQSESAVKTV